MVGYTFYDQLWLDLEKEATKTEAEQMAWLNKQAFNQDTRDCTVHAGEFTTWLSYTVVLKTVKWSFSGRTWSIFSGKFFFSQKFFFLKSFFLLKSVFSQKFFFLKSFFFQKFFFPKVFFSQRCFFSFFQTIAYKQWATKQLKLQVVSYQPRIEEIGFTQSNCRYTRWMAFMRNPRNYELMGYDIDTGVIMANAHHQMHWYLREVHYKISVQAIKEILSVGLIAWEVFMMCVNLALLRMGMVYMRSTPGKLFAMVDGREKHRANIAQAVKEREQSRIANKEEAVAEHIRQNPEKEGKLKIMRNLGDDDRQDIIEQLRTRLILNDDNSDYIYESNYFELALTRTPAGGAGSSFLPGDKNELTEHNQHHFRKSKIPTKHNGGAPFRMKFERLQDISIFVGLYIFVLPLFAEFFAKFNGLHRGKDAIDPTL